MNIDRDKEKQKFWNSVIDMLDIKHHNIKDNGTVTPYNKVRRTLKNLLRNIPDGLAMNIAIDYIEGKRDKKTRADIVNLMVERAEIEVRSQERLKHTL